MKIKSLIISTTAFVMLTTSAITTANVVNAADTGKIVSGVNFRTAPSTSSDKIRLLKSGETVTILSKTNSYWYKIKDKNGKIGYVSTQSKYIKVGTSTSGSSSSSGSVSTSASKTAQKIIDAGLKYWGTPYEFGSSRSNTNTFDCSDFVRQVFKDALGITLPSDSRQQGAYVKELGNTTTNWRNLKKGDLMFFMSYKGSKASSYANINKAKQRITHVGIYMGDGKVLHTYSKDSGGVRSNTISGTHWEHRFMFGGSAIK